MMKIIICNDIKIELRIYQNDECNILEPEKEEILYIIDRIKRSDDIINNMIWKASIFLRYSLMYGSKKKLQ